jgi:hypothetical protein
MPPPLAVELPEEVVTEVCEAVFPVMREWVIVNVPEL